jgi:hypothetical protein
MIKKLLFVTTLLFVVAFVAMAADVTGKWTYEQPGFQGGDPVAVTITLKQDGEKLTGSIPPMMGGRGGGGGGQAPAATEISNGKVDGNKVYFEAKRAGRNGAPDSITKYEGTIDGESMKLKITRPGRGGADPTTNEYTAKKTAS